MSERILKRPTESCAERVQILMPEHINGYGRLFGDRLMEWIDIVAGVVARRHSGCNVTTAAIDNLQFEGAAHVNNTLVLQGRITHVGTTSMEVRVDSFVEHLDGSRTKVNRAYLVMVALDENEKPTTVPGLILETEEDKAEWEAGEMRDALRKCRRADKF